jgi:hypothetical protein
MKTIFALALALTCGLASGVETNNVPAVQPPPGIFKRVIKVDPGTLLANVRKLTPPKKDETNVQVFVRHLKENKVRLEPPAAVSLNEKQASLLVYATREDMQKIETIIGKLNREER